MHCVATDMREPFKDACEELVDDATRTSRTPKWGHLRNWLKAHGRQIFHQRLRRRGGEGGHGGHGAPLSPHAIARCGRLHPKPREAKRHEVSVPAVLTAVRVVIRHVNLAAFVDDASATRAFERFPANALEARGGTTDGSRHRDWQDVRANKEAN